ncbi:MAG: small multi-drug export protein, partial [Clostridiales Family XIII bacterium]|nr:small multi-drug export protein [Clostridiales Family XIII bacterium]
LLFLRKLFALLKKSRRMAKLVLWLEAKAEKAERRLGRYELLGLFLFVAIPLPGTGAWTGSLIAAVFDMRIKRALPVIAAGVVTAGAIMSVLVYLMPDLFSKYFFNV